ncbi:MAG: hypothetical protein HZA52_17265 [Planctomycetes bacterium]|nr:hypothetical protein [Planctomycetota bacterium]
MLRNLSFRPLTAVLLAVAGFAWLVSLARLAAAAPASSAPSADVAPPSTGLAGAGLPDGLLGYGFFVLASFGGALAVWWSHRRAAQRGESDPGVDDPSGVYIGAALFGGASLAGALLMTFNREFMERYFD